MQAISNLVFGEKTKEQRLKEVINEIKQRQLDKKHIEDGTFTRQLYDTEALMPSLIEERDQLKQEIHEEEIRQLLGEAADRN